MFTFQTELHQLNSCLKSAGALQKSAALLLNVNELRLDGDETNSERKERKKIAKVSETDDVKVAKRRKQQIQQTQQLTVRQRKFFPIQRKFVSNVILKLLM